MIQIDHDYLGQDYSVNVKTVNPSPSNFIGVFVGSYLQSITKNLAVGFETLYQRPAPQTPALQGPEMSTALHAKLTATDKSWIATAQVQHAGILQATYWQKLSEKVEVAVDLHVLSTPTRRDAIATLGAKYDFRLANFRAQLDSTGKVSALLEQRFHPAFAFLISGEIDHFKVIHSCMVCVNIKLTGYFSQKNAAKVGVGVMLESFSAPEEMGLLPEP
jgi:mitochondrial import receptor subunit TOM40